MVNFRLRLAGISVEVYCEYDSTKEYCSDYLTDDEPEYVFYIKDTDIRREKALLGARAGDAYAETLALYRAVCEKLCERDIFLLHGSAVAVDGETYIFIAPSGTGKSTHSSYWRKALSGEHDVVMVNDDKPLIRVTDSGIFACGTPWSGVHRLNTDVCLPVRAICLLRRGETDQIGPLESGNAFSALYQRVYLPKDAERLRRVLAMINKTVRQVSFWSLSCGMSEEAALLAYGTMKKGEHK